MPIKLLAIGDMHLGRQPSRLPQWLAKEAQDLSPISAWGRCVEQAIAQQVDVVVLAGDLVDQEDNFFEAYRPLEQGINRLVKAGIEVIGVSGNHDVSVLPRLAEQLSAFQLLGKDGVWQRHVVKKNNDALTLHGWSFPKAIVTTSPLAEHVFELGEGLNVGLLHCDRDQTDSRYAPVSSQALNDAGLDAWLLGHVHIPDALTEQQPSGYLGSVTGLHVGEHGPRGPWLITIDQGKIKAIVQWRIAPVHWAHISLDLSKAEQPSTVQDLLLSEIKTLDQALSQYEDPPKALGIRLLLEGQSSLATQVIDALGESLGENLAVDHTPYIFLESIQDRTLAPVDLNYWAKQPNHAGHLAHDLMILQQQPGHPKAQTLIDAARNRLAHMGMDPRWQLNSSLELPDALIKDHLIQSGHQLLRELIAQLEETVE